MEIYHVEMMIYSLLAAEDIFAFSPHQACLAVPNSQGLDVWTSTQAPHTVQADVAEILDLSGNR